MITKLFTAKQYRQVKTLVKKECCNYNNGYCILLDDGWPCVCPQIISMHPVCKWFKSAVLPLDKELHIVLEKPKHIRTCAICGKDFIYSSNREKYCNLCKRTALLRRKKKYRLNKGLRRDV